MASVLVVDDDVDGADSLASLLQLRGHEVRVAYDGRIAVIEASRCLPDVVFLDLNMPHPDGFETAKELRSLPGGSSVRVVALTANGTPADRRRTAEAGFERHLVKPADWDQIEAAIGGEQRRMA